ncbi:MAG: HEAT repeat domain-containing protein [Paludibacter sp.]
MKTKIILLSVLCFVVIVGWSQNKTNKEWIKNLITSTYSLKYEQKMKEDLYKQNQRKYASNIDLQAIDQDIKSVNVEQRLSAIKILGLIPISDQISKIEDLLVNDPSQEVRVECAKSLKYLNSTNSIPLLLKTLQTGDNQLKLEVALTLAALGEKTECLKTLMEIGKYGDRNTVLNTHIGYLDIATNDAIDKIKTDLSDENSYISVDAAIVLSELGYFEIAFPILKEKLSDKDKYIRMAAMRGLAYIGNDNSIELIRDMLNDSDILVKERSELILNTASKSSSLITSYSPANAASYAEQWYGSFNPAYANYDPNDCANFGSQCLKAGGMNLSSGPGLDSYGCIPACDNLHTNFTTYQGCTTSSTYSGHKTSGYPTWFGQGDIVLFGANASSPNDPWQHTAINVVTGTPALDAHSNSRHQQTVSYFYPSTGTGFKTADFYHFNTASVTPPSNDNCANATLLFDNATCSYTSGTVDNATDDGFPTLPSCNGTSSTQYGVFYKFVAAATTAAITVEPSIPSSLGLDAVVVVYKGSSCYDLNQIGCLDPTGYGNVNLTVTGLNVGQTYWIRIYDYGSFQPTIGNGGFRICVSHTLTDLNEASASDNIKIYPNPTTGKFEISGIDALGDKCKIEIFNHLGVSILVSEYETIDKKISLDLSTYPAGMYLIQISNNGVSYQRKVVKK